MSLSCAESYSERHPLSLFVEVMSDIDKVRTLASLYVLCRPGSGRLSAKKLAEFLILLARYMVGEPSNTS